MNTIVIGYDATEAADRALERGAAFAQAFGASLIVTSIAPVLVRPTRSMGRIDLIDSPHLHEKELEQAKEMLTAASVAAEYVTGLGDPADVIVDLAVEREADLIIVGTREPSILQRMLGLSVSGAVSRHAHCDVLIVH
jgi:nucleotide-binding universal stress UspA family protein